MTPSTHDRSELEHFKKFSAQWWEGQGPFAELHAITPLRMAFLRERIEVHFKRFEADLKPFQGLRILDVGCGGGLMCEPLARLGAEVTGIDLLEENIGAARGHARAMGLDVTYIPCGVEDLPQQTPPFDVIVASEIIEHVVDQRAFLEACVKHLKPHGGIFVTTFNKTLKSYALGIVAAEYVLRLAPRGTHSWEKFISPQDLSRILSSLGLGSQEMAGLSYFPMRGWKFSPSMDVNYFLWAGQE